MTSALSSLVWAIELFELPKVMPITTRSAGSGPGLLPFSAIVSRYSSARVQVVEVVTGRRALNQERRRDGSRGFELEILLARLEEHPTLPQNFTWQARTRPSPQLAPIR